MPTKQDRFLIRIVKIVGLVLITLTPLFIMIAWLAMLHSDPCAALLWGRAEQEFIWQMLPPRQCFVSYRDITTTGTLTLGYEMNNFTSDDGRVVGAQVSFRTSAMDSALKGRFVRQNVPMGARYRVRIQGVLFNSGENRTEISAFYVVPADDSAWHN